MDEVTVELGWVQLTPTPNLVHLNTVVCGLFTSTVGDELCDDVAITSTLNMGAVVRKR